MEYDLNKFHKMARVLEILNPFFGKCEPDKKQKDINSFHCPLQKSELKALLFTLSPFH